MDQDLLFYRKTHAGDGIENGAKYYVYSNNLDQHPTGDSNEDGTIANIDSSDPNAAFRSTIAYNGDVRGPRGSTVNSTSDSSGEMTFASVDSTTTTALGKLPKLWVELENLASIKKSGVFGGIEVKKCENCTLDDGQIIATEEDGWDLRGYTFGPTGKKIRKDLTGAILDTSETPLSLAETISVAEVGNGVAAGYTYVVKGEGYIVYPVRGSGERITWDENSVSITEESKEFPKACYKN